jgi:hypothetical protein
MNNIRKLSKSKLFNIIQEELESFLSEENENEVEELALRLMKSDPSLSKEEAISIARSAAFRKQQQGTIDYSSKTGSHEDDDVTTLNLIRPRLEEGPLDTTTPEGVPPIPRGKVPTQKQSGIERGVAAMLNDLLSRVEELENAGEDTRKLLHQILRKMGAKI